MVYVIAEIGFGHGGSESLAAEMVRAAAGAGADAVKLQSFFASDLYFPDHELYPVFEAGELPEGAHARLAKVAEEAGIEFLSTPFSPYWVDVLDALDPAGFKIASMDVNNPALQKAIAATGRKVYLSTGASDMAEVQKAIGVLREGGAGEVVALHCVSNYPTKPEEVGLWMIPLMRAELGVPVGFSDHTLGMEAAAEAAALGAVVIEKHFTIDKNLPGPDHALSADPAEIRALVEAVKDAEPVENPPEPPEGYKTRPDADKRSAMRRGIYAGRDIAKGEVITLADLKLVRPEVTPLGKLDNILNTVAKRGYKTGEAIEPGNML